MEQLPLQEYPAFAEEIDLDGISYVFDFRYNATGDFWSLSILSTTLDVIVSGIILQMGIDIFSQYHYLNIPQGQLFVIDPSGNDSPIQRDDFVNGRLQLCYASEGEL